MLNYQPKGALSPALAKVMSRLFKVIRDEGLMASLCITDGRHGEFFFSVDPDWSACTMHKLPGGDIAVRFRSKRADYKTAEEQKAHLERTVNALALLFKMVDQQCGSLAHVMTDLQRVLKFSHYGEEFKGHTCEAPDPDKVPATLGEAADLIHATLDTDQLQWVAQTPLSEAMGQLHHGFGRELRNSWSLWEDGPLRRHVQEQFGLFGHADDLTALIFSLLWSKVRGEPAEVAQQGLELEVEGMKAHWQSRGVNPATGERGIIVP